MIKYNTRIRREVDNLGHHLRLVDRSLSRLVSLMNTTAGKARNSDRRAIRRSPRISAQARSSLVLQGRYMGYMRQLKPRQKAQVRKIREAKGVSAAIQRAMSMARQ